MTSLETSDRYLSTLWPASLSFSSQAASVWAAATSVTLPIR